MTPRPVTSQPATPLAATPHPDWLRHVLHVSGPAADMAAFRHAAQGAAAIPWQLDLDQEEARLLAPMATQGIAARVLARELRAAIAAHHERVLAQIHHGRLCPLDLHRLVPVPGPILQLGPDDNASQRWLWERWGTLQPLRHVRVLDNQADGRLKRTARWAVEFFSADWSPWRALVKIRTDWPNLVLHLQPVYGDPPLRQ